MAKQLTPEQEQEKKFKAEFKIRSQMEAVRYRQEKEDAKRAAKEKPKPAPKSNLTKFRDWMLEHPVNQPSPVQKSPRRKKSSRKSSAKRSSSPYGNYDAPFSINSMMSMSNPFGGGMQSPIRRQKGQKPFDYLDHMNKTPF